MNNMDSVYRYGDGTEICLGDTVIVDNYQINYVERIWKPNSPQSIAYGVPRGGLMLREKNTHSLTVYEYDSYDISDLGHLNRWIRLANRATLWFHINYSWTYFKKFLILLCYFRVWKKPWWECCCYNIKMFILTLGELFQAVIFGPGKNVRQLL